MIWLALLLMQPANGERLFAENCSVGYCHGVAGAAGRGPRLRGRSFERAYLERVIRDGIPNSAMPGWKSRLAPVQIRAIVDYVAGLATVSEQPAAPPNAMPPGAGPGALNAFHGPPQAERGLRLFFDATRETHCGTCHAIGGRGIAIGPDVAALAGKPRAIAAAVRATESRHVLTVRLKDGEVFPVLRAAQEDNWIKLYDLTTSPPVLRTLERGEIESLSENHGWRHHVYGQGLTDAQLADLAAYIQWAATGSTP